MNLETHSNHKKIKTLLNVSQVKPRPKRPYVTLFAVDVFAWERLTSNK